MQTMIDPFELASTTAPRPPRDVATSLVEIDVAFEEDAVFQKPRPSPDSSGRLRCWCSEED